MTYFKLNILQTCSSTNDVAIKKAQKGLPEGSSYLSYLQTNGRGRNNNQWESMKGNLFLSTIFRPTMSKVNWHQLSLIIGLSILETLINLGSIYFDQGDDEKAIKHYSRSIKISEKLGDKFITSSCINNIGNIYKNQGNFKLSGKFLNEFTSIHYSLRKFDIEQEKNFFNNIKDIFQKLEFTPIDKKIKVKPIFICGMPRSGTSLCEQILSTHSKVVGAGELSLLTDLTNIEKLIQTPNEKIKSFQKKLI